MKTTDKIIVRFFDIEYTDTFPDKDYQKWIKSSPKEVVVELSNDDFEWTYFGTKLGFLNPDSVFEDYNDYSDESAKEVLDDLFLNQELPCGDYHFEITVIENFE